MNQGLTYELLSVMPAVQLTGLLSSTCNILTPPAPDTPGPLGQVDLSTLTPVTGLQGIACARSAMPMFNPSPSFKIAEQMLIREEEVTHVLLQGCYPAITQNMVAQITDPLGHTALYDIRNVEADSQTQMTRLAVRVYSI